MANLFSVKDKVVVMTGAAGILGRTISSYLAGEGAKMVILDRNEEAGNELVNNIKAAGNEAIFLYTDVLNKEVLLQNKKDIIAKLEKGFPLIATTAAGAPMLGFLGTVTGMVRAFFDMANAGTNVDVTLLSGGIYEALVTTVGGLVVGIITLFAYNYLVSQVDNVVNKMEARTMEFMDLLNEPAN